MSLPGESDVSLSIVLTLCTTRSTHGSLGVFPRPLLAQRVFVRGPMRHWYKMGMFGSNTHKTSLVQRASFSIYSQH